MVERGEIPFEHRKEEEAEMEFFYPTLGPFEVKVEEGRSVRELVSAAKFDYLQAAIKPTLRLRKLLDLRGDEIFANNYKGGLVADTAVRVWKELGLDQTSHPESGRYEIFVQPVKRSIEPMQRIFGLLNAADTRFVNPYTALQFAVDHHERLLEGGSWLTAFEAKKRAWVMRFRYDMESGLDLRFYPFDEPGKEIRFIGGDKLLTVKQH